jgi:diguanylate cyclase (GGDEF)-like protein
MKKVLVVDDNKMNTEIVSDILAKEGYKVYALSDGVMVLETALLYKPDAILLDIIMPNVDGFEVCERLKKNEKTKDIPIIMITAISNVDALRKAFDKGAFDFIRKPFDKMEIVARLKSAIRYYEQQQKLESLAMRDGLTNLYNHRMVMELLDKKHNIALRNGLPIAFIMLDIDYFKKVNDTYGHKSGDYVIKTIAAILQNSASEKDIVGRYGGEEFCIICLNYELDAILNLGEKLRKTIEDYAFIVNEKPLKITTSIGIAYKTPFSVKASNKIITSADKKLYEAKRNGRNCVRYKILK